MDFLSCVFLFSSCLAVVSSSCGYPPAITNSKNNLNHSIPIPENTVVEYSCSIGFRPDGARRFTCMSGEWIGGPFECVENFCPALDAPEDGYISNNPNYKLNTFINFSCKSGYTLQGSASMRCRLRSSHINSPLVWIGTPPTCEIKFCPEFGNVANGNVFQIAPDGVNNDYGSIIQVTCNEGYTMSGKIRIQCQADGTWEDKPSCVRLSCPDYPGLNTSCIDQAYIDGDSILVYCIEDANKVSPSETSDALCIDGQWSDKTISCPCNCECKSNIPGVVYDNCNAGNYLPHKDVLTWRCQAGFRQKPMGQISCHDGVMSNEPVCELIPTMQPPPTTPTKKNGKNDSQSDTSSNDSTLLWGLVGGLVGVLAICAGVFGFWKWKNSNPKNNTPEKGDMKMDKSPETADTEAGENLLNR